MVLVYLETPRYIPSGYENYSGRSRNTYLHLGTAVSYGIDLRPIWDEVHKTNMAKIGGPKREDGKSLKPDNWKPPRIKELLEEQINGTNTC